MARKSKFFRVATEGATTDGRKIERKWLQEIASSYNQATYGARIFIEHIRGINPNAQAAFRAMGDVLAVRIEEVEDGKLALFAQIDPTDALIAMAGERQKIYSSIEVAENFAGTGKAYLIGLGVTDSPASLGTEILAFAAQNPAASPFTARKQSPENLFSAGEPTTIEFEDETPSGPSLLATIKAMFAKKTGAEDARFGDVHAAVEHIAAATARNTGDVQVLRQQYTAFSEQMTAHNSAHEKMFAQLSAKIDHTPSNDPQRPAAAGGSGAVTTDC